MIVIEDRKGRDADRRQEQSLRSRLCCGGVPVAPAKSRIVSTSHDFGKRGR
eukprot:CAMPEP_0206475680 /NCGR_PEP_ID=MMETSP0324_2-20121206/34234_1 /ASSEMBLY_ACC=CAM_ASM_000836 /TAXON_ID=2866 /ORGANISM="Crypthecodinium cohnii, Strain Seligo" /LENGTH=50 /DNA_ID=CAMNT_0053951105 /DNA_START=597 /DNA_END=749 /DNA_ORIENTATION=+